MEYIGDILASLIRPLAKITRSILPSHLKEKFEPNSQLGDFIGFGVLTILLSTLIFIVVLVTSHETKKQLKIDSYLDNGGKYDYQIDQCEHR